MSIVSQNSGSWLSESDAERMVFRPSWTFRLSWKMYLLLFVSGSIYLLSMGLHLVALRPSDTSYLALLLLAFAGLGGVFALLFVKRLVDYRSLVLNLTRRTYRCERGWPFGGEGGSLDEMAGVFNSNGHLFLSFKKKPRPGGRGYLLGLYGNPMNGKASATAERLTELIGFGPTSSDQRLV